MSYSTEIYNRLKTEFSNIGLNIETDKAFYKAFCAGCETVFEFISQIMPNYFLDVEDSIGYYMYCSLFDLKTIDKDKFAELLSTNPEEYKSRSYWAHFRDYVKNGTIDCSDYVTHVSLSETSTSKDLISMAKYLNDRLSAGVVGEYTGEFFNFDKFDSLSLNADEWEKIASASFTFIDSLGGILIE